MRPKRGPFIVKQSKETELKKTLLLKRIRVLKNWTISFCSSTMDDEASNGTRLRHIKHKPTPKTHGGPAVYHCLPCFELTSVPPSRSAPQTSSLDPLSILDTVEIESVHSEVHSPTSSHPQITLLHCPWLLTTHNKRKTRNHQNHSAHYNHQLFTPESFNAANNS